MTSSRIGVLSLMLLSVIARRDEAQRSAELAKHEKARVVFVCEHGTVKSVVALEHFNRLAQARGLDVVGVSRGTRPDTAVPEIVRRGLARDGFDLSLFSPRAFTRADLGSAMLVVALDADVAPIVGNAVPVAKWDGLPSVMSDYDNGRRAIVARVEKLVDSLAQSKAVRRPR
jgi:protein-tyrosine-phosphatase